MPHYYSKKQSSAFRPTKIKARLLGKVFEFYTASGVFSPSRVDKGTEVLVNHAVLKDGWNVLDLGAGYGVVGIAVAKAFPKSKVVMTEVNERAVKLSRINARLNNVENVDIRSGNMFEKIEEMFDAILLNPPQSAGKKLCFEMIEQSAGFLKKKGLLQLVARHNKGGKPLSEKIEEVFGNVKDIAKKAGYRVYLGERR